MLGWQPSWNKKRARGVAWGATGYWGAVERWGEGVRKIVAEGCEVVSATMDNSEEEEVVVQIQVGVEVGSEGVGESGGREEGDGVLGGRSDQEDARRAGGNPVDRSHGAVGGGRGEEGEGGGGEGAGGEGGDSGEKGEVSGSSRDRG